MVKITIADATPYLSIHKYGYITKERKLASSYYKNSSKSLKHFSISSIIIIILKIKIT
jgi:hypothetical protein